MSKTNLRYFFIYWDNPEKIRARNFNKLLNKLNKPLFTFKEQNEN